MKNIILIIAICFLTNEGIGQTKFHIEGGNINIDKDVSIVLENTTWQNDGNFQADSGSIFLIDGITVNGQNSTAFHNLIIDNIGTDLDLFQDVLIANELEIINGIIRLNDVNLEMEQGAFFSGIDENNFIQTNSDGQLIQTVGSTNLLYPIGASTFNPAYITNSTSDNRIGINVYDSTIAKSVNRVWNIQVIDGSSINAEVALLWDNLTSAADFDATESSVVDLNNSNTFTPNFLPSSMSTDFPLLDIHTRDSINQSSIFTVSSDNTTSTTAINTLHKVAIYPNPTSDYLIIESEDLIGEYIQIFDVNGRIMMEFQHQATINKIQLTDLSAGTYFIKIGNGFRKIVVQK